ncbi:hypothetical protein Kpol_1065p23 [Vanderwaltozyma polyspora DSM 70294]|uniref:Vacuolar import and degradation protein 24 n=1 Tax=Vanderwaltozyma polyspora (strain ATCC 22028 / DSM 70294 / BCRC 21397 / CBS 2163 / NBRC 10782 / NRRL Y-8283 / UCD 57-17) TaxID=436907 RepID=A7TL45_VANPO|nr:uncharacterized protein Kpol_1065p23 [Vanderwaltozyma polyspora DSM 70294]EDO17008.1 hypothetical protein Kpol_1065p23 [Vanderwaltozyma polyspora DSM 70294]
MINKSLESSKLANKKSLNHQKLVNNDLFEVLPVPSEVYENNLNLSLGLKKNVSNDSDDIYKCSIKDSIDSLNYYNNNRSPSPSTTPISATAHLSNKKLINTDNSSYSSNHVNEYPIESIDDFSINQTNFLTSGYTFNGYQISGYKKYQVTVTLNTVNLPSVSNPNSGNTLLQPHITGLLSIKGLTNQYPEISTFFEAYVVTSNSCTTDKLDSNFGFLSSSWSTHESLDPFKADDQTDIEHWSNFSSFHQLFPGNKKQPSSSKSNDAQSMIDGTALLTPENYINQRYIFMRWKEKFLVPYELNNSIEGASFDGYYYIVHDQLTGSFKGYYYHKNAERFQQLELVPDFKKSNVHSNSSFEFA